MTLWKIRKHRAIHSSMSYSLPCTEVQCRRDIIEWKWCNLAKTRNRIFRKRGHVVAGHMLFPSAPALYTSPLLQQPACAPRCCRSYAVSIRPCSVHQSFVTAACLHTTLLQVICCFHPTLLWTPVLCYSSLPARSWSASRLNHISHLFGLWQLHKYRVIEKDGRDLKPL